MRMFMMVCAMMLFTGCGGGGSTGKDVQSMGKHTPPAPEMATGEIKPPEPPRLEGE